MKFPYLPLFAFMLSLPLCAQSDDATVAVDDAEAVVIPTEISEPPYELGDLVVEQGFYIERGEGEPRINFRIVDNKMRVYWIDENGLIAEPEYSTAVVRFTGSVRGRAYHSLSLLPSGVGLGSAGILPPPHLYNAVLVFPAAELEGKPITHTFRYTSALDVAVDPTTRAADDH
jgi:hypothetical protein